MREAPIVSHTFGFHERIPLRPNWSERKTAVAYSDLYGCPPRFWIDIVAALARLDELLGSRGVTGEICLFGGTVMVLVFNARISTRDVDAIFQPASVIRELAVEIAEERRLPLGWLNDGVKGFQSESAETTTAGLPQFVHLRIFRPTARYLLAMKCLAARPGEGTLSVDREDIETLVEHLQLRTVDEVLDVVEKFYPIERIPPKTQFMVHEVISALQQSG